jgi:hypothetical protein
MNPLYNLKINSVDFKGSHYAIYTPQESPYYRLQDK